MNAQEAVRYLANYANYASDGDIRLPDDRIMHVSDFCAEVISSETEKIKRRVINYLMSLIESIEGGDVEIRKCDVTEWDANSDNKPFDIKIEMSVVGFTVPLYYFFNE